MLMQRWDPETTPGMVIMMLTLGAACGIGTVLFRAVAGRIESSLDIPYRDARNTVLFLIPIGVGIIVGISWILAELLGLWLWVELPLAFSVGVVAQASVFSRRHSVSLRRALPFSLAIAAIPIVVVATIGCTAFVANKVLRPYWDTLAVP